MTQTKKRFTAQEFSEVWAQAYEDVRDLHEAAALLLPQLETLRQGVLGAEVDEQPRRRQRVS